MTLEPGDIVSTGTPSGVGGTRDPHVWLKPGDELVISSPHLGRARDETPLRRIAALGGEHGDEHERQEPDDVEVEPVRGAELDGDRDRRRERGDLERRAAARVEGNRDGEHDRADAHGGAQEVQRRREAPDAERRASRGLVAEGAVVDLVDAAVGMNGTNSSAVTTTNDDREDERSSECGARRCPWRTAAPAPRARTSPRRPAPTMTPRPAGEASASIAPTDRRRDQRSRSRSRSSCRASTGRRARRTPSRPRAPGPPRRHAGGGRARTGRARSAGRTRSPPRGRPGRSPSPVPGEGQLERARRRGS